ncbi:aminopeptidase N [Olivibacter domesticus]|uniref:Aminopeptidase N n=2 Tax=Olivibacter domesticus TaxID=407022 RepID=A0A1H7VG15_OLID1|nr:aminopeptidase N [Olivibacter domesticus]
MAPVTIHANAPDIDIYHGSYPVKMKIIHTALDLRFDWTKSWVMGNAKLTVQPYFYPQDSIVLDANGFEINNIWALDSTAKRKLNFSYDGKKIQIALGKKYTREEKVNLLIDYIAKPNDLEVGKDIASPDDRGLYFIQPDNQTGVPRQLWTQGETECNANWFPTINNTMLKMSQQIKLTVPDTMVTLSNGLLKDSTFNTDGTRTDTWVQEKPHAPYLVMIAVGKFDVVKDKWRDKEVSYYMEPAYAPHARLIFGKTPEMLEFFSQRLGVDYPWDKYAQIVVRNFVSGAMENTSASVFFDRMNMTPASYKDETYEDIVAHELFHHWFGDLVTAESWSNLPLNESFATYGEYLWMEHKYGKEAADMHGLNDALAYLAKQKNATLDVIRFDYADSEQMFDEVSYQKGGRILHMLRKTVGDEAFFEALKRYLKKHAYQSVEIHDLRLAFEEVTGQDLNWFFNQWFLASGNPYLVVNTSYDDSLKQVVVALSQQQDLNTMPLYRLPLKVDLYYGTKVERKPIVLDKQQDTFRFASAEVPKLINVDAEKYLLAQIENNKTLNECIYQYLHGPLFMDRFEAVQQLADQVDQAEARRIIVQALKDKAWLIRLMALGYIDKLPEQERMNVYPEIKKMALDDERSYVRASAIVLLKTIYQKQDNGDVLKIAGKDNAPSVQQALMSNP